MIKELFLAIILGATLGFGATGAYFALTKTRQTPPANSQVSVKNLSTDSTDSSANGSQDSAQSSNPSPTPELSSSNDELVITSPENESIVANSKVTLKGTASPKSLVIIRTPVKSYQVTANDNGNFEKDVEIESGVNIINVSSFSTSDVQSDTEITVTYSTAKI